MDPVIVNETENDGVLSFTLSNTNVSIANALRRTMLADIPCVVFRTTPYSENRVSIDINTSRMNNELLKQRLSCIPIHINDTSFPINNYEVHLNVSNNTDSIIHVTTKDLQIKDVTSDSQLTALIAMSRWSDVLAGPPRLTAAGSASIGAFCKSASYHRVFQGGPGGKLSAESCPPVIFPL